MVPLPGHVPPSEIYFTDKCYRMYSYTFQWVLGVMYYHNVDYPCPVTDIRGEWTSILVGPGSNQKQVTIQPQLMDEKSIDEFIQYIDLIFTHESYRQGGDLKSHTGATIQVN